MTYIVELEPGVWIAGWPGDPGRTIVRQNAKEFSNRRDAEIGRARARRIRKFADAQIHPVSEGSVQGE